LQSELADKINLAALDKIRIQWERNDITKWDFGILPEMIPLTNQHGLIGYAYPALQLCDDSINIRLFADQRQSIANHIQGVAALYSLHFADKLKQLQKNISFTGELKTMAAEFAGPKLLEQSIIKRVKKDLFGLSWRNEKDFLNHALEVNAKILQYGRRVLDAVEPAIKAFSASHHILNKSNLKNAGNNPVLTFLKETKADLQRLVPPDFPELYSFDRIKDLPRYLKALALRAERGSLNLAAARKKTEEIEFYKNLFEDLKKGVGPDTSDDRKKILDEFFWMIEEYKVSLFAQELKTSYPVSPKKLNQLIKKIDETL
jgi:ATP-dependent helicase HrpA